MIKNLLESSGASFVNRSYGMATTGPISLMALDEAEKEIRKKVLNEVLDKVYDVIDSLSDVEERSGADCVKDKVLDMLFKSN